MLIILVNNQIIAGELGAIDVILNVMRMHINDINMCNLGCSAFRTIMCSRKTINTPIILFD